tara:strand:- start:148 stop:516 length:369 start_codon:yes stop_codon:yes gene_type:complete
LDLIKLKVVQLILKGLKKITLKLLYLQAKYEADDYAIKNKTIDLRGISDRIKSVLLHDQSIIDKRWDECSSCEYLIKATNQCKKCGCFMKVKTKISTARCPIGKWEKEFDFIKGRDVIKPAV